ncbi:hypothetical protein [Gordonibacter sp.]
MKDVSMPPTNQAPLDVSAHSSLFALETPCFVFDEVELRANFTGFQQAMRNAWGGNARLAYSVKTNPHPWIVETALACDCWAEVVSDQEYDLALACGFKPESIVFNGPIKGKDHVRRALHEGSIVNLDSARELRWLAEFAAEAAQNTSCAATLAVGLRVNIDLEHFCPGQTTSGANGGRFGYCRENGELAKAIEALRALEPQVRIAGLHMHVTTYSRSLEVYRTLARHAASIAEEFNLNLDFVDIGGGFFGGGPRNTGAYESYAEAIAEELRRVFDPARTSLIVEPGGAVVCTPGSYAGRVVDAKDTGYGRFVTSELSRINIDHEMKKTSYAYELLPHDDKSDREVLSRQVLCGYTCMESDRLCLLENEPCLEEGDLVVIANAGAYSMSFTPGFFIERAPATYARDAHGRYRCVDSCRTLLFDASKTPSDGSRP